MVTVVYWFAVIFVVTCRESWSCAISYPLSLLFCCGVSRKGDTGIYVLSVQRM